MGKEQDICSVKLKNVAGIPVVEIVGVLNQATVKVLENTISHLANAGHYNIVLNIKKVVAPNLSCLEILSDCVSRIRSHYGVVQVVAEAGQVAQLSIGGTLAKLFRFCTSEGQAFQRIKGLLRPEEIQSGAAARIWEKR